MNLRPFDPAFILQVLPELLPYLGVTLWVGFSSIGLGSALGVLLAWARLSRIKIFKLAAGAYTYVLRCTPSIVLLFIVFYGLPRLVEGLLNEQIDDWDRSVFAILTFSLLFGAYISEVFRAAYQAVPRGQYEAAVSIGLSPLEAVLQVVLPQAALVALPNFGNSVINLLKEGALAYTIGLIDFLGKGNLIIAQNYGAYALEIYLAGMLVYWLLNLALEQLFARLEQKLDKGGGLKSGLRASAGGKTGRKQTLAARLRLSVSLRPKPEPKLAQGGEREWN